MIEDAHTIISRALDEFGGQQKSFADSIMVCCPFHDDSSPSCGVFMAEGMQIPLGFFNCFGCGVKGPWNMFAEKAGLPTIKKWNQYAGSISYKDLEEEITSLGHLMRIIRAQHTEWPADMEWRGYSGKLIRRVGGVMINDNKLDDIMLFFPVEVNGKLRGGVKAYLQKPPMGMSYLSTRGHWVKKYGLFPFAHVRRMMERHDALALVEGPRDALRLISNGIPAMAVLGGANFGREKALMVSSLLPERVFVVPDTDQGGDVLRDSVKAHMSRYCQTKSIALGRGDKKIDPDSASQAVIDRIKDIILG